MNKNFNILIPARCNSKGLPFKNRILIDFTLNSIPDEYKDNIIVNTDDEVLINKCIRDCIRYYVRPKELGLDETSTKDVVVDMINNNYLEGDTIMLYLTYPERTWDDVTSAYNFFVSKSAKSLLCKKEHKGAHPYLCMYEDIGNKGIQIVEHNLYRRQDYPAIFEISHFISIFNSNEVSYLNNNLYNKNTIFFKIEEKVDVDSIEDLYNFKNSE
jgi:CMP-N-acetylneuraminic acid synthetase